MVGITPFIAKRLLDARLAVFNGHSLSAAPLTAPSIFGQKYQMAATAAAPMIAPARKSISVLLSESAREKALELAAPAPDDCEANAIELIDNGLFRDTYPFAINAN